MQDAETIYTRVATACARSNRDPKLVRVLGAIKKQSVESINAFITFCNARGERALIGENYVQEWSEKRASIRGDYECHFIGHLQSNKAKEAVELFSAVQSVDSVKLVSKLNDAAQNRGAVLPLFLQVNISEDEAKSGIDPRMVHELIAAVKGAPALILRGLMTIPKLYSDPQAARLDYRALAALAQNLENELNIPLELSMGMSDDFEIAIEEGATIVRIGSALFGARM